MDIRGKIKEAEVYQSMGMFEESLAVYETLLAMDEPLSESDSQFIGEQTRALKTEIGRLNENTAPQLTAQEISLIKKTMANPDGTSGGAAELMDSASAFQELGLMEEAAAEYGKILEFDPNDAGYPPVPIISSLLACLMEIRSPDELLVQAKTIIDGQTLSEAEKAQIQLHLGETLELRGEKSHARELFKSALDNDPQNLDIKSRIDPHPAGSAPDSKFDYLIDEKIVSPEQLQKALAISKKSNISVEKSLVDHFKIDKEDVGKSLSLFYDCPFKSFDPDVPVPIELIGRLKKAFLIHYAWVPLSWSTDGLEVLVDDPRDLRKTDHIKALMATDHMRFSVGIKEDIIKYIERFFSPHDENSFENAFDDLDAIIPDVTFEEEDDSEDEIESIDESSSQVVKFVDQVLVTAFRKAVSDIHIEPSPITRSRAYDSGWTVSARTTSRYPTSWRRAFCPASRLWPIWTLPKKRLPQDGKIKMKRKGIPAFELRLSTMPTAGGFEDAVLRILAKAGALKLDDMGLKR